MTVALEAVVVGGNRHSSAADWAPSLLAFGAGNNVALWNPDDEKNVGIAALLAGHTDNVNAVRVYGAVSRVILSGSSDKTIRIWTATADNVAGFRESQCLTDHTSSINVLEVSHDSGVLYSGSADGTVKVWDLKGSRAKLIQSISLKPRYLPLALAITSLSNGDSVLAAAGTCNYIQLYVRPVHGDQYELQATLTGHEGWIRSLDFTTESLAADSDILLASASQDKYIRLWRFHRGQQLLSAGGDAATDLSNASERKSLSNKVHQVGGVDSKYSVTFEALLIGHEDWIYTARWEPRTVARSAPVLLSASADNSLSIWGADSASGLWVCNSRLGEISGQKGSTTATGSTGGFWVGLWRPEGGSVVSLGRTGSWRQWRYDQNYDMWKQQIGIGGHVQEVQGLAWSPEGSYLLSTGSDQTTRLWAEWHRDAACSWHEFSRPQIHGYDLNCIDSISENRFISGAEEKLLRVFNKPKAVGHLLAKLTGAASSATEDLPDAANIPVLGLSNKAMDAPDDDEQVNRHPDGEDAGVEVIDSAATVHKSTIDLPEHPPLEDHLARHTLWPEHEKLYGHGYEICAVATSNDGCLVATACKASSIDHAVIRLYETSEWREVKPPLAAHSLTVTSLAFSPDDDFLLSVGRDRQWFVFKRGEQDRNTYTPHTSNPKGHSRMILGCAWAPASLGHIFATAGRDKNVKIWKLDGEKADCVSTIPASASVTAVSFCPSVEMDTAIVARGTEDGRITLIKLDATSLAVKETQYVDQLIAPCKAVTALRWRPGKSQLAAASEDYSVRIYNVS
ncbi:related to RNA polymerase II Elongator subunit [Lecanosticta acicola]|uniref:Elongator complex protein 2 n=1 Tax=Lecanosticta acicola TaxID=111012 RepID=A0AAI8YRV1_9PEZI|nr:related to RNA polymerase II Elongator subunit [Lecanosticta acicola]